MTDIDLDQSITSTQTTVVELEEDYDKKWLSLKESALAVERSPHTLKKLVYKNKFGETRKEVGKNGEEVKINLGRLLAYYNLKSPVNVTQTTVVDGLGLNPNTNPKRGQGTGYTSDHVQSLLDHIESLKETIDKLNEDKVELYKLLKNQQEITTNQQSLSLQQNQLLLEDQGKSKKGGGEKKKIFGIF